SQWLPPLATSSQWLPLLATSGQLLPLLATSSQWLPPLATSSQWLPLLASDTGGRTGRWWEVVVGGRWRLAQTTVDTNASATFIPRVTSTQGSLQIRCKNISSTVQEFNTSMAHPTTTSEVNICTVLNTSGTITQTFNGACTFNTTPSCSVDPTTSTHLVNKTYVDTTISAYAPLFMAPRLNCVSYNLGNMNLPISTITSQYYEYSVNYTNNTSNQWSNVIYPAKTLINKNNIHYSSSHQ
ncbi:MAG: hypothetical protein Q8R43_01145, partial [Alphaproteobacteria bacterium]|nr:hypothetical protein [Alphaproteobacteria bacterium]